MSFFGTHDPFAVQIGIRLMRILPLIEKLAGVKNSEMFRTRLMGLVDRAYGMASSNPTLLKETKRVVRRELKEAVDGGDVREARIQAEEWSRLGGSKEGKRQSAFYRELISVADERFAAHIATLRLERK